MTKQEMIKHLMSIPGNPELRFLMADSNDGTLNMVKTVKCEFVGVTQNGLVIFDKRKREAQMKGAPAFQKEKEDDQ